MWVLRDYSAIGMSFFWWIGRTIRIRNPRMQAGLAYIFAADLGEFPEQGTAVVSENSITVGTAGSGRLVAPQEGHRAVFLHLATAESPDSCIQTHQRKEIPPAARVEIQRLQLRRQRETRRLRRCVRAQAARRVSAAHALLAGENHLKIEKLAPSFSASSAAGTPSAISRSSPPLISAPPRSNTSRRGTNTPCTNTGSTPTSAAGWMPRRGNPAQSGAML